MSKTCTLFGGFSMFQTKSAKEVLQELNVNSEQGLSNQEADERLLKYGPNKCGFIKRCYFYL